MVGNILKTSSLLKKNHFNHIMEEKQHKMLENTFRNRDPVKINLRQKFLSSIISSNHKIFTESRKYIR